MATTPLIKTLNTQGGTFLTFSSSAEDLALTFNNDNKKFRFSKYVLLNIPNFETPSFAENAIQFDTIDGAFLDVSTGTNELVTGDLDIDLAQSFQNYCLNLEALVASQDDYDPSLFLNVSERIFWKWMKELGAIRFRDATTSENAITDPRFVEEDEVLTGSERYNRVVQYIGEIDIVNNVNNNVNAYTELYIHIPNDHGNTPTVLFETKEDVNYKSAQIYRNNPENPLNIEYLVGRNFDDTHPSGLEIRAIFDQDVIGDPDSTVDGSSENWYDPLSGPNAYFTEDTFVDSTTNEIVKADGLSSVTYKRSRLDGISIDFAPENYKLIVDNPTIDTVDQFNSTAAARSFEFNAVLVYYDVYNPQVSAQTETNLFGILFLEDIETISLGGGRIPRFNKFVPDSITKLNGNSFAFKVNLKFDTSVQTVGTEKAVNDYSTFSLEIFTDTTNTLLDAAIILNDKAVEITDLQQQVTDLEALIVDGEDQTEIEVRLTTIEDALVANQAIFDSNSALLDLINNNSSDIDAIISGNLSESLTFDLDVFRGGDGIFLDKAVQNRITVDNTTQAFNLEEEANSSSIGDVSTSTQANPYTITLKKFGNYFRHENPIVPIPVLTEDLYIQVDDELENWQKGQILRLVFEDALEVGTFNIIVVTDTLNIFDLGGVYNKTVAIFSSDDFDLADDTPIFDIVCVNDDLSDSNAFIYDQIR